ncbi:Imm52 family immunity protein [Cystobacter fuscus]
MRAFTGLRLSTSGPQREECHDGEVLRRRLLASPAESAEECARRSVAFFRLLAQCDEIYARWFEQGDSLEEALQRGVHAGCWGLPSLLQCEENQLGKDGFSLGAWTGHAEAGRGGMVQLTCGDASGAYPNSCVLYLPRTDVEPEGTRVLTAPVLVSVLRAMVLAWEPLFGVIATHEFRRALRPARDPRASRVGSPT